MIQSTAGSTFPKSLGFENLVRIAPQPAKGTEDARLNKVSAAVELTPEQQQQVAQLKQTDLKVRAHEQAHIAVGAELILSGPSFSYTLGPDSKRYAVSGEVSIDTSPGRTPAETIPKAQHIRATALAPVDPSAQDHSVAAQASQLEGRARQELLAQQREEAAPSGEDGSAAFYRGVERSDSKAAKVGGGFDIFA